jgi:hypothetical protein
MRVSNLKLKVTLLAVFSIALMLGGCRKAPEGFAVYLTRDDVPPATMPVLSYVNVAEKPLIAMEDVIAYDAGTHSIKLTADAYERISRLEVPVRGKSFVVCVDKNPIYWGAFWTPISSVSFDGVIIMKPLAAEANDNTISIDLGYPAPQFFQDGDPRDNTLVMESMRQAGKLK